jgi:hypothetical protein
MLNHIRAPGDTSVVHGYMIHSPCFQNSNRTTKFWQVQAAIILELHLIHLLSVVVATDHPEHDGRNIKIFSTNLKLKGWILSSMDDHHSRFMQHYCWLLMHHHHCPLVLCIYCETPATQTTTTGPTMPSWQIHVGAIQPERACNLVGSRQQRLCQAGHGLTNFDPSHYI